MTDAFLNITHFGAEWVLWLLVLLSFVSIAIMVDRGIYFYSHHVDGEALGGKLYQLLRAGDLYTARQLVMRSDAIEYIVVAAGLAEAERGHQACSEAMLSAKARERVRLDAKLAILGTLGSNAPFVGLLGTVLGIIKAAHDLAQQTGDQAGSNAVMSGVFEALVATAVGLFVAIPAVIAFNYFQRRVRATIAQVDSLAHLVLASLRVERRPAQTPPIPVPPKVL